MPFAEEPREMIAGLIRINEDVFLRADDVVSVEREIVNKYKSSSPSDGSTYVDFDGSRITLKNGRKVFVRGMVPRDILKLLEPNPIPDDVKF